MLTCYLQPGKAKSRLVLEAFAAGCGGRINDNPTILDPDAAAAFFGVVGIEHLLRLAIAEKRDWFYGDNAFFDAGRGRYFRFAKNAMQVSALAAIRLTIDRDRLSKLDAKVSPWRKAGTHIVIAAQSDHFLNLVGRKYWLVQALQELKRHTDRPVRVRCWSRGKEKAAATLHADLDGAWALVTHMSAAANEALLAGVPVFTSGRCAATPMASGELSNIESPRYPDGREDWAAGLAGQQWTLAEMRSGLAWRTLNALV